MAKQEGDAYSRYHNYNKWIFILGGDSRISYELLRIVESIRTYLLTNNMIPEYDLS